MGSPSNTALKVLSWPRSEPASGASSLQQLAHEAHDGGGIEAAREARAHRHLAHQAPFHAGAEAGRGKARVGAAVLGEHRSPVGVAHQRRRERPRAAGGGGARRSRRAGAAVERQLDAGGRGHVVDALEERLGAVVVEAVQQVLEDHLVVRCGRQLRVLQQGLDLAGEQQPAAVRRARVVERLDAEVVAAQHERAVALAQVGDGVGPHAVEARRTGRAPLLVGVHDDLGVAGGAEGVAGGDRARSRSSR